MQFFSGDADAVSDIAKKLPPILVHPPVHHALYKKFGVVALEGSRLIAGCAMRLSGYLDPEGYRVLQH